VKGQTIYKCDKYGRALCSPSGEHLVDDDVDEISNAYKLFKDGKPDFQSETYYTVKEKWLNSRLDVEHYFPKDQSLLEQLKSDGAKPLGAIADILKESDDFRLASD